jgi:hypothetical protein
MPVIPAIWEAKVRDLQSFSGLRKIPRLYSNIKKLKQKGLGGVAQVVEYLRP